jgi:asparagine synthase (glutamine-hydrolysing)
MALARMLQALSHRGPDGEGTHEDASVLLGHRRLAIIDLSDAARQPMPNETKDVWLTLNGEIYNFVALRDELRAQGHVFRSRTDCEVVVHGYEAWGIEGLLSRLSGMFAFALWDSRVRTLYLARDRFGIKPLYYGRSADRLVFASELPAPRFSPSDRSRRPTPPSPRCPPCVPAITSRCRREGSAKNAGGRFRWASAPTTVEPVEPTSHGFFANRSARTS